MWAQCATRLVEQEVARIEAELAQYLLQYEQETINMVAEIERNTSLVAAQTQAEVLALQSYGSHHHLALPCSGDRQLTPILHLCVVCVCGTQSCHTSDC